MPLSFKTYSQDHFAKVSFKTNNFFLFLFKIVLCLENEKPEAKQKRLEAQFANLQIVSNVEKLGTAKVSSMCHIFNP